MKKQFIIYLLSFIIIQAFSAGAVKKIEANPINIAVMLTQETDTAKMVSTLDYYGYKLESQKEGYSIFTHPNGSLIRYQLTTDEKYPIVEVLSRVSAKEKDLILKNLNFQKQRNNYERKSVGYLTRCATDSHGYLLFRCISK